MIKGSLLYIKDMIIRPFYLITFILFGLGGAIALLLKELESIGKDGWKEEHAGDYDYKQDNGLGTKKIYREKV